MSKYIIKNCPCYYNKPEADCWADQLNWCQNYTDCVLKQIVELCKGAVEICSNCDDSLEGACINCTLGSKAVQGDKILKLLDIQEVE
jgi:hypothetical protein